MTRLTASNLDIGPRVPFIQETVPRLFLQSVETFPPVMGALPDKYVEEGLEIVPVCMVNITKHLDGHEFHCAGLASGPASGTDFFGEIQVDKHARVAVGGPWVRNDDIVLRNVSV